ncbi:major facilitator superfamily transporter [Fusarium langsethiae]|uniref:Major facilitator superfamily transporter n=1 Tax=Fusarium langsethiae TaxID=179993 RepID=A0A0M9ERE4_FUSLA|nr:major facilitator superfamily transporter [Fusarium langsethiae]
MAKTRAPVEPQSKSFEKPSETTPLLGNQGSCPPPTFSNASSLVSSDDSAHVTQSSEYPHHTENDFKTLERGAVLRIVLVLLIAVFIFNADRSLVLATHPSIGSEFGALDWSSWLFTGFSLAGAATQTILGKLGDIYGCKPVILFSYIGFAIGCFVVAVAQSMFTVILGRVLSGSVGAGMTVLVSILITDLVPVRETASWRSYINVAATTGRSLGGPLGGWMADAVGWRWSFGLQVPVLLIATFLCWQKLPDNLGGRKSQSDNLDKSSGGGSKLARLDFVGLFLLAIFILLLLLPMELGGKKIPWSHPVVPGLFMAACISLALFIVVEKRWAKNPVLDLNLFKQRDVVLCLLIATLQSAAQLGVTVLGNALGGILCGYLIKRSGKYKCGFGMGMTYSALFVAIQASVKPGQVSAALSTLSLCSAIGVISGVATTGAIVKFVLENSLETKLYRLGLDAVKRQAIISQAATDIGWNIVRQWAIVGIRLDGADFDAWYKRA